jgi:hypothetical protein
MTDEEQEQERQFRTGQERKVFQAREWVEQQLRMGNGPWPAGSAVLVVTAVPMQDDPENALVLVSCLPDFDHEQLADAVINWAENLRKGIIGMEPHGLPTGDEVKH